MKKAVKIKNIILWMVIVVISISQFFIGRRFAENNRPEKMYEIYKKGYMDGARDISEKIGNLLEIEYQSESTQKSWDNILEISYMKMGLQRRSEDVRYDGQ